MIKTNRRLFEVAVLCLNQIYLLNSSHNLLINKNISFKISHFNFFDQVFDINILWQINNQLENLILLTFESVTSHQWVQFLAQSLHIQKFFGEISPCRVRRVMPQLSLDCSHYWSTIKNFSNIQILQTKVQKCSIFESFEQNIESL